MQTMNHNTMKHATKIVSIHPYFKAKPGKLDEAKAVLPKLVAKTATEELVIQYDFTIHGNEIFCRESYVEAEGLLAHVENVGEVFEELLQFVDVTRLEVHGPEDELEKLKPSLAHLDPTWFVLECGVGR